MSRVARQVIGHTVLWRAAALLVVGWGAAWVGPSGPGAVVRAAAAGPSAAVPGLSLPAWPQGWSRPHFLGVDVSPLRPWLAAAQGAPEDARPDVSRFGAMERAAGAGERGGANTSGAADLVWVAGSSLDTLSLWVGRWDPARAGRGAPWALRNPRKLGAVPQISAPPSVARDAQGQAYVAWCEKEGAGASVRLQPLRAGGGPPATLLRRDWPIESASLARDGQGRLWLVWLEWPAEMAVFAAPIVAAPAGRPPTLGPPVRVARSQQVLRLPKAAALGAVPASTAQAGAIPAPGRREESALVVAWVQGHSLLAAAVWRDRASGAWQVSPAATLGEAWDKDETGPVVLS
ncbi:MAG: hypothetical protein IMW99_09655, partial [Firmicutes bacterium]|nr:hypothetical protein [Bacillota bacterium]